MATAFLVAVEGLHAEPQLRSGDISTTGVYFETGEDVGDVGTIHWLRLVSSDRAVDAHVMANVVRTVVMADARGRRLAGVAFEFMPESDDAAARLHDLVRYVLTLRHAGAEPHIQPRPDALAGAMSAPSAAARPVTVRQLSVRSMVLETSWAIAPGEPVRVDIVAPGMTRRIRLDGRAVRVAKATGTPAAPSYAIEVEVQEETDRPLRRHSSATMQAVRPDELPVVSPAAPAAAGPPEGDDITRTLDDLLSALILPPGEDAHASRCHHLSGQIARVRLPTLLALFDMERMTGRLVLTRGAEQARIHVKEGQIMDVEPVGPSQTPRARMGQILRWEDGGFEFYMEPVHAEDRVGAPTTALLLDLAREEDEAKSARS